MIRSTDVDLCPQTDALWMAYAMAREYGSDERKIAAQRELYEKHYPQRGACKVKQNLYNQYMDAAIDELRLGPAGTSPNAAPYTFPSDPLLRGSRVQAWKRIARTPLATSAKGSGRFEHRLLSIFSRLGRAAANTARKD